MADETQVTKYVTLDTLKSYDGKLKPWVKDKIDAGLGTIKFVKSEGSGDILSKYTLKYTDSKGNVQDCGNVEIDIPKDFLVKSGSVVIVKENPDPSKGEESPTDAKVEAGTYIKLVINTKDDETGEGEPLYISVKDLYSDYTVEDTPTIDLELGADHKITAAVKEKSITVTQLADNAVETLKIKNEAVTGAKIAIGTVTGGVENDAATGNIAKNTIVNANLVDKTIESGKIADSAIITDKIADGNVTTAKINAGAVTDAKLAKDSVITDKILDANVTESKIAVGAVTGGVEGGVASGKIAAKTIVGGNIADGTIVSGNIADGTIVNGNIADTTIARVKIDATFEEEIKALEEWQEAFKGTDPSEIEGLEPGQDKPDDFNGFDWT